MTTYITGDKHGRLKPVKRFAQDNGLTEEDAVIVLGDVGFNYFNDRRDYWTKNTVTDIKPVVFCIHGNHEMRPQSLPRLYREDRWHGGTVFIEDAFPNILFAKDGEVYDFDGARAIAIGGAYSVDKWYRIEQGLRWFEDEQPNKEIKACVEAKLDKLNWKVDIVLSHTCPFCYEPTEAFLPGLDQSLIDSTTELWLDRVERRLDYKKWYCGHWRIDKHVDRMRFMFDEFEPLEPAEKNR